MKFSGCEIKSSTSRNVFQRQRCPMLDKAGKSSNAYDESSIKLTGVVRCTDTMCTGVLMAACYCMRYVAVNSRCGFMAFQLPQRVTNVTTASAMLLLSGSGIFQVWHMQKVLYYRNHHRRAQLLENVINSSHL